MQNEFLMLNSFVNYFPNYIQELFHLKKNSLSNAKT